MPKFYYVEACVRLNDTPDMPYFRHTVVAARTESEAYSVGMTKQLGRSHERLLNTYVIRIGGEAATEDWPTLSGRHAPGRDELEVLVRDWALRRLRLAWDECHIGHVNAAAEEGCIVAGMRLADFAVCLGGEHVEALVRDVEREFSKQCAPGPWAAFSVRIVPDSQEGRYPRPFWPTDQSRAPFLKAQGQPHSTTGGEPRAEVDNQSPRGGDGRLRHEELEALVTHWAKERLRDVASHHANSDAPIGEDEHGLQASERVEQLAGWLGTERVEELVQEVERSWVRKMAPDVWKAVDSCHYWGL